MEAFEGNPIKVEIFSANKSSVKMHPIPVKDLELMLTDGAGLDSISLELDVKGYRRIFIKSWMLYHVPEYCERAKKKDDLEKQGKYEEGQKLYNDLFKEFLKNPGKTIQDEYEAYAEKLRKGEYVLHVYGNGKLEFKFK